MNRRRPLAAVASNEVPIGHLAATAQMLADMLVAAAEGPGAEAQRPRLQLVGNDMAHPPGDARLAAQTRQYLRARRLRDGLFPEGIFADPAWEMLLDLYACTMEGRKVCVSDACGAAGVPPTTALRWVDRLEDCGLVERRPDPVDSRRIYVELTLLAIARVELWLNATFNAPAA